MRKLAMVYLAGALSFVACSNDNSSTVGTYEREDSSTEKEDAAKQGEEINKNKDPEKFYIDSSKSVDSSLIKKDAGASPEKNSVNMQPKATRGDTKP